MRNMMAIVGAGALILSACGGETAGDSESPQDGGGETASDGATDETESGTTADGELQPVSIGITGLATNAPLYIAQREGWFEEAGLDVSIEIVGGAAAVVPALSSGEHQIGSGNLISTMQANQQGIPLVAISGINTAPESCDDEEHLTSAILVPEDSDVQTAADLEGKTVTVNTLNNLGDLTIKATVENDGGDPNALQFTEINFPDMIPALQADRVDAIWEVEPFVTLGTNQGLRVVAYNFCEAMEQFPLGTYFVTQEYYDSNSEAVDAFQSVMERANDYVLENEEDVREVVPTYTQIPEEAAQAMALPVYTTTIPQEKIEQLADLVVRYGLMETAPDDLDAIFSEVYE